MIKELSLSENILHETFVGEKGRFRSTTIGLVVLPLDNETAEAIYVRANDMLKGVKDIAIENIKGLYEVSEAPKLPDKAKKLFAKPTRIVGE
jgi:hypothetical protein